MKLFCVTSRSYRNLSDKCIRSVTEKGLEIEEYLSISPRKLKKVASQNGTFLKYTSSGMGKVTDFKKRTAPLWRISNGLTHFLLYKWAFENDTAVCIFEADAILVGDLPEPIYDGVIQISSHKANQLTAHAIFHSGRNHKFRKAEPEKYRKYAEQFDWECLTGKRGVLKAPFTGTIGTSGYIVGPAAAKRLVEYFQRDGIGFADRVREEHVGEGNLYLQVPQSVVVPRHNFHKE